MKYFLHNNYYFIQKNFLNNIPEEIDGSFFFKYYYRLLLLLFLLVMKDQNEANNDRFAPKSNIETVVF
jgi:hypothetical protein